MDEVTTQRVNELVAWLTDTLQSSGDFVMAEAPSVARQTVLYGLVWNWSTIAIQLFMAAAGFCMLRELGRRMRGHAQVWESEAKKTNDWFGLGRRIDMFDSRSTTLHVMSAVWLVVFVFGAFSYLPDAIKATFAPKLYLIEYVTRLV